MMLKNKVAVIYGAGGAIGGAVARAFASEGANLFLTGRHLAPVEVVTKDIVAAGGSAEAGEVDALDEQAVDQHLESVTDKAGRVDISFNAIGIPNPKIRVPLVELDVEQFSLPIATYTRSYFVTARLAARRMVANRSGVIMTVTAVISRTGIPLVGGGGPPWRHSLESYPPSSHLKAFAWSVCDHRASRRQAGSRKASSFTPRHRE
jgi:NAD(P)-dependent dehydrogenase (short-subunit alcohol dehydrogenase family)